MSEAEIKLFGTKIPLPEEQPAAVERGVGDSTPAVERLTDGEKGSCKEKANAEVTEMLGALEEQHQKEPLSSSALNSCYEGDSKAASKNAKAAEEPKPEGDHKEDSPGEEKALKKPDKILPCPRCNSMDTKFCYYNNYNVNQPRHFCKNCQRYWTAGGAMRNVPVGAGRRKNKHSVSSYRHAMITPDALASVQVDGTDLTHHQALPCGSNAPKRPLKDNGTLLKFGPDAPLCESMASVLSLGEQKKTCELGSTARGEIIEETSCSSSVTAAKHAESGFPGDAEQNAMHGYRNGISPLHHLQCFPGPPWAYPWNQGWNNVANLAAAAAIVAGGCSPEPVPVQENCVLAPMPWTQPPMLTTAFCAPAFPFPIVPASFWGCMPGWIGGPWNLPLVGNGNGLSPSSSTSTSNCSGNGSPTLGKHSRDATSSLGEEKTEKSLWIPKTLRIDDPDAASKSSFFATLGIKPDECGMFKAFPSKAGKGQTSDATQVLHANPAALSRSQSFQETTT